MNESIRLTFNFQREKIYKDNETNLSNQATQSIDTTGTVITETFESLEKLLPDENPKKQYEFATSFLKVGDYSSAYQY